MKVEELSDGEMIAASIKTSSEDAAKKLVDSNQKIAEKLLASDNVTAYDLLQRNAHTDHIATTRFNQQNKWNYAVISVSLLTLVILTLFTIAFFKFAIIVRT
jgi:uncharacterized membrane protein affecting hemolysin expression